MHRYVYVWVIVAVVAAAGIGPVGPVEAQAPPACLSPADVAALQAPAEAWRYFPLGTVLSHAACVARDGDAVRITWPGGGTDTARRIGAHWYDVQYSGSDVVDFRKTNYPAGTPQTTASWVVLNVGRGTGWLILTRYTPGFLIASGGAPVRTEFSFQFCQELSGCKAAGTAGVVYLLPRPTPARPFYDWRNPAGVDWYHMFGLVERYQDAMNDFYPNLVPRY